MPTDVPLIYSPRFGSPRLTLPFRLLAAAVAFACLALLVTAATLHPNPAGTSTHTQLGLAPCQFLYRTGIPCISCGMTTSFSLLVHGHPLAAFYAQPFGALLCLAVAMLFWTAAYASITARPVHRLARRVPLTAWFIPLLFLSLAAWAWKILITVR